MRSRVFLLVLLILPLIAASVNSEKGGAASSFKRRIRPLKSILERNKKLVLGFLQKLFGDKDFSAIDEYLSDNYIQHNPMIEDGKEGIRKAATEWLKDQPKEKLDIKRTAAEGDLVWIHLRQKLFGKDNAIVDIFRVENKKIVEHWDVIQEVPKESKNNNGMFL